MRRLLLVAALATLAGCASTLTAKSDFDREHDFSGYRSFAWTSDDPIVSPPGARTPVSALKRRRIVGVHAALTDLSGGQTVLSLSGPAVRDLLAKG